MAFKFLAKNAAVVTSSSSQTGDMKKKSTSEAVEGVSTAKKVGFNFLKTGNASKKAMHEEDAKAAAQQAEADKMWRFWLEEGTDAKITFLDGELDEEGLLDIPTSYEHFCKLNGKPRNFICVAETEEPEECPLCERGDSPKSFVGYMTILDHRKHTIKKGPNAGKFIINDRKLFVAKRGTLKMLTKIAVKRDGLAGCQFDASRTNEQSPNVGNIFDFTKKFESFDDIASEFKLKLEDVSPADIKAEVTFYSAEELIALGVGKAIHGPGYASSGGGKFGKKVSAKGMAEKL